MFVCQGCDASLEIPKQVLEFLEHGEFFAKELTSEKLWVRFVDERGGQFYQLREDGETSRALLQVRINMFGNNTLMVVASLLKLAKLGYDQATLLAVRQLFADHI